MQTSEKMDIALAMPCIVREDCRGKPLTCASLTDASSEQSDSEKRRSMWKSEAKTYGPRCWKKKDMWAVFTVAWYISRSLFKNLSKYQKPKLQLTKNGKHSRNFWVVTKRSKLQGPSQFVKRRKVRT